VGVWVGNRDVWLVLIMYGAGAGELPRIGSA
jgi:hypothetical protein